MPNHCENDLYIRGDKEDVDALLSLVGAEGAEPKFDFNQLIPEPPDLPDDDNVKFAADGMLAMPSWYTWRCEHWGTKWNAYEVVLDRSGDCTAVVHFETAWAPPKPIFYALAEKFPKLCLCLEYYERGMEFCGGIRRDAPEDADDNSAVEWQGDYKGLRGG